MSLFRTHRLLAVAVAAAVSMPALADAQRRGRSSGSHARPAKVAPRASSGRTTRPRVRDHRGTVRPPRGDRPRPRRPVVYWPRYYYGYGYWPYYHDHYYGSYYYGPPGTAEVVTAAPPPPRPRVALGVHLGQLEHDGAATADVAGLAVRWRGQIFEGELEIGRRVHDGSELRERSLAATLYAKLGHIDSFHPYVLAGAGALDSDRLFGQVGAGLALPVASRLTVTGDLRAASIGDRVVDGRHMPDTGARTLEGRLTLLVDF